MSLHRSARRAALPLFFGLLLAAPYVSAQISEGGTPPSRMVRAGALAAATSLPTVDTGPVDVPALLAEDAA
ncbi:MAG TPA: hypothetical protein PKY95_05130, partial [candidate division Zixibacteria bacterium]|nr:hypothetical protein [candidate division Zixibacteria bacterium]